MRKTRTPFGCTVCKKEFSNTIYLLKHVEWRHQPEQKPQLSLNIEKDLVIQDEADPISLKTNNFDVISKY